VRMYAEAALKKKIGPKIEKAVLQIKKQGQLCP
jgi:hypothetical protein